MLQTGTVINETYRVERVLGSGGMADVYLVTHTRMPRQFALKVMRPELAESLGAERFLREMHVPTESKATLLDQERPIANGARIEGIIQHGRLCLL